MTVKDVRDVLGARVLAGEEFLDREVKSACGSDMMSDVLAFSKDHSVLLTGLCNPQVIRTAEMLDIVCIIFVRGKKPDESMLEMARDRGLVVMETGHRMFSACLLLCITFIHTSFFYAHPPRNPNVYSTLSRKLLVLSSLGFPNTSSVPSGVL